MMKHSLFALFLVSICVLTPSFALTIEQKGSSEPSSTAEYTKKMMNLAGLTWDSNCVACTVLLGNVEKYAEIHSLNIDTFLMNDFCKLFKGEIRTTCQTVIGQYGPEILDSLLNHTSPDKICRDIKKCTNPECNLYKNANRTKVTFSSDLPKYLETPMTESAIDPWKWLKDIIDKLGDKHLPVADFDGDYFGSMDAELRGYNWRGKDCNDLNPNIYPGRKVNPSGNLPIDYNCNGISGIDPQTRKSYKDLLCGNSSQLGVVVMGDSVGAHAVIPTAWADATQWNSTTFDHILNVAMDEVDLPHFSGFTGYADTSDIGPVNSVYKHLYERNKCNHRDYQNIAVNGARSGDTLKNIAALARNQTHDHPLLVFLELVGNDVCNSRHNFDSMTTPEKFRENILKILDYLDTRLPFGSHIVSIGLANGSMLWDGVQNHTHPLGVSYADFYEYLNCLDISFCWGWMNSNETVRNITTEKAFALNRVYQEIAANYTWKNFDFVYYDLPIVEIWAEWTLKGNDPYYLIVPTDGFHPSQIFHSMLGDHLWNHLMEDHPDWLGEVNPNNDLITKLFGDQGGY